MLFHRPFLAFEIDAHRKGFFVQRILKNRKSGNWYQFILFRSLSVNGLQQWLTASARFLFIYIFCSTLVLRGRAPFGQHQESRPLARPDFLSMRRFFVSYSKPIRFVRFDGNEVNRGVPLLNQPRGRDSWCWPKGARPLGTRMFCFQLMKPVTAS